MTLAQALTAAAVTQDKLCCYKAAECTTQNLANLMNLLVPERQRSHYRS